MIKDIVHDKEELRIVKYNNDRALEQTTLELYDAKNELEQFKRVQLGRDRDRESKVQILEKEIEGLVNIKKMRDNAADEHIHDLTYNLQVTLHKLAAAEASQIALKLSQEEIDTALSKI